MSKKHIPYSPRVHTPVPAGLSTTTTTTTSSSNSDRNRTTKIESDFEVDTYALAQAIGTLWNVDDPELVVIRFGAGRVADVHRRMLYMSRRQKLSKVRSLDGYFMSILIRGLKSKSDQPAPADERSDEFFEEYKRRQAERGAE